MTKTKWTGRLCIDANDRNFFIRFGNHRSFIVGVSSFVLVIVSGFIGVVIGSLDFLFGFVVVAIL